jgi:hypothetical protein
MGKFVKWLFLISFGLLTIVLLMPEDEPVKNKDLDLYLKNLKKDTKRKIEQRYNAATQDQKNCVNTLGQGVYKDKSLKWKLDSCNVPK